MFQELFTVSQYPSLQPDQTFGAKLLRVFKTYGLVFLGLIAVGPILVLADKFVKEVLHHKSLLDINQKQFSQLYKYLGKPLAVTFICVIGPLMEELIFRLWLNFKKRYIAVSALIAMVYFGMAILKRVTPQLWLPITIGLATGALFTLLFRYRNIPSGATAQVSDIVKHRLIILSMVAFALMHVSNYRPELSLFWIYPIYVIPQLIMGWGITYVRFKNGFAWGVVLHMLMNTVATLAGLWMKKF
ncbi:CPBP family glutamic-type intramembrane protease [Mucilaginibacter myungsuensis]|uniref:CPBP family intramembrane metalloprotease n=1 Tax=Mucilaginibacter myungsuensis TaxID=649104 RepID=A0A929L0D4_9SPHI|nr:CPBP family glutamic-type intramembrane protease [Mucilaginibacter myungsuensis]MBE9661845.1 CPBP family intramembrane metalloprotease [Mucilaginibacter myungsuensis]MDN3599721.1 CPBP family glutamic-type intramembrane protease [Mucilaginibacter myungsuensis]